LVLLLGGCFGDRVISEVFFAYQCKNNSGLFVYEKIKLGDGYFIPIKERELVYEFDKFNDFLKINKPKILIDYDYSYQKIVVNKIGPVEKIISQVVRKNDKKVMAEGVAFQNHGGWLLYNSKTFVSTPKNCGNRKYGHTEKADAQYRHGLLVKIIENDMEN
jgi:hypothetical protein